MFHHRTTVARLARKLGITGWAGAVTWVAVTGVSVPALAQLSPEDLAELRKQGEAAGWTFTIDESEATRRPLHELCGLIEPPDWRLEGRFDPSMPRRSLPSSYDWRDHGCCTPVRSQGGCGSCWAFAAIGALENVILINNGVSTDLSEQWLVSCTGAGDCGGGWHSTASNYLRCNGFQDPCGDAGAVLEADFPYVAWDAPCGCPYAHPYCMHSWAFVGDGMASVGQIQQAILDHGPVATTVFVDSAFQGYSGGIFNACQNGPINHAVVLVGWDDSQGTDGVWIMRNSWGPWWGEGGYMRIEYGCSFIGYSSLYHDYRAQDCNQNGVRDWEDIIEGTSRDCNADDRPDECGVVGQCELDLLTAADLDASFGDAVSVSGDVAVIGTPEEPCPAGASCGSAYVYRHDGIAWFQEAKLAASTPAAGDLFGYSASVSGDVVVIGAYGYDCAAGGACGAGYVYRFNGVTWELEQQLAASDAAAQDFFGIAVSVDEDVAVIGAYAGDCGAGVDCGAAYVYRFNGAGWDEESKLTAADADRRDFFGGSVSVHGSVAAVGAYGDKCPDETICGAAYVYRFDGAVWNEEAKLEGSDGFGYPVVVRDNAIAVGAPWHDCAGGEDCGEAYVFTHDDGLWSAQSRLAASEQAAQEYFGRSVAVGNEFTVVGASGRGCPAGEACGVAYLYHFNGNGWAQDAVLSASEAAENAEFGMSAAVGDDTILVGEAGAVHEFTFVGEDCNCNAAPDLCDLVNRTSLDDNGNGVPDECEAGAPLTPPYPYNRPANRYISFAPHPDNSGLNIAFKVELKSLELGSCSATGEPCRLDMGGADCGACSLSGQPCIHAAIDCIPVHETCDPTGETCVNDAAGSIGKVWWVGPAHPTLGNDVHLLVTEAYRKISDDWPAVVHVGDCEIVPRATYGIRSVQTDTGRESNDEFLASTIARPAPNYWADAVGSLRDCCTGNWAECPNGDADCPAGESCIPQWSPPDGFTNFADITAAVFAFQQAPGLVLPQVIWVDIHGDGRGNAEVDPPNYTVNFSDIAFMVLAFQGRPYPFGDPGECPGYGVWP